MILPFRFCRKHVLQRACGGMRDQNALPGVPAIRLQPSLRSFDVPENTRLHVGSASMMKSDCQHIWKQHPCPMCWPPVAPDFILLTVDNQLQQLGRPQATIRFWCGALKYECRLVHAQARPLRGRLHARQKEKKNTQNGAATPAATNRDPRERPKQCSHCHRSALCFCMCFCSDLRVTLKAQSQRLTAWRRVPLRTNGSVGSAAGNTYNINCIKYVTMP